MAAPLTELTNRDPVSSPACASRSDLCAIDPIYRHIIAHAVSTTSTLRWRELWLVGIGGLLVIAAWISGYFDPPAWFGYALVAASIPFTSHRTLPRAIEAVRELKVDIDVLMFVAAAGAMVIGHPVEGGFLLLLFGLGSAGEAMAMQRAEASLQGLEALVPDHAEKLDASGDATAVPLDDLGPGDLVRVRAFERVPADGVIDEGQTSIDESTLTGESIPVEKRPGDTVFSGTLNTAHSITIRITHPAGESALARVVRMIGEARANKATVERTSDWVDTYYAPSVLILAGLVFAVPSIFGIGAGGETPVTWIDWFYRSMAFLTAASPCALVIGAPATMLCAIAAGARRGIVFKGGASVEALADVRAIAFDKTGTLTTGSPAVRDIIALGDRTDDDLLALAAAIEQHGSHPLAAAIRSEADARGLDLPDVTDAEQVAGEGVVATFDGQRVRVGSPIDLAGEAQRRADELAQAGYAIIAITIDDEPVGLIAASDDLRPDSSRAIASLSKQGIDRQIMLTGDHERAAKPIAEQAGVDAYHAGCTPEDKLRLLAELESSSGSVAMVGDGANDAPALARAAVSLSMGAAASDVAAENADIAIMGERLLAVAEARAIALRAKTIMRQNLIIALGVIATVAPLAVLGFAELGVAVVLHEGSTVVVVLNALRLLRPASLPAIPAIPASNDG